MSIFQHVNFRLSLPSYLMEPTPCFRVTSSVFAIAPHLFPKAKLRSIRHKRQVPLSTLHHTLMAFSGYESDPPLSDDTGISRYAQRDAEENERSIMECTVVDGYGEPILWRMSRRMDGSDTSSSFCVCH
jgi:hypothetical protein